MFDSWRPHGLQPTRLLRPWDFPGESAGVAAIPFSNRETRRNQKELLACTVGTNYEPDAKRPKTHAAPPMEWADHLSHFSGLTLGPTPYLLPILGTNSPSLQSKQKNLLLILTLPCCSKGPQQSLEFLVWPFINFY